MTKEEAILFGAMYYSDSFSEFRQVGDEEMLSDALLHLYGVNESLTESELTQKEIGLHRDKQFLYNRYRERILQVIEQLKE